MKTLKSPLVPCALLLLQATALPLHADQFGDFTYTDHGTSIEITDYPTSATGPVEIPATIVSKPVTSIGKNAFRFCRNLISVTIPSSVTSIGHYAFEGCSSLSSVTIPPSVTGIGTGLFFNCDLLSSITVDAGNPNYSSLDGVLFDKSQTVLIQCPGGYSGSYAIPSSVTSIGNSAFNGCSNLTSVTISSSVSNIGNLAFSNCSSLTSVTVPFSVTNIGNWTFAHCSSLTSVTIPSSVTNIGMRAFTGCSSLTSVTIPSSVTSIRNSAFSGCSSLTSMTISSSVISIGSSTFRDCSNLTNVTFESPFSLTSIGSDAFNSCTSLTSVTIPSSVITIGDDAFSNCDLLSSITVDAGNPNYSSFDGVLFDKSQTLLLQCPEGYIGSYLIPSSVTSIEGGAFQDCPSLVSVTLPRSVSSIGILAFDGCSSLTSVTIPSSVTNIGRSAFLDCTSLTSVTFDSPSSVTNIGRSAFLGCTSLTSVTIPSSVTSIGDFAFSGCSGLTSLTIPFSVTSVGSSAFNGCSSLAATVFTGDAPVMDNAVFGSTAPDFTIYYLTGSTGFTSPTWEGYPAVMLDEMPSASGIWLLSHGLPVATDLDQDHNGDGITLLTAYALNLDPNNPLVGMPQPVLGPGTLSLTFHGAAEGITYGAETSTDCQTWVTEGVTMSDLDPDNMRTVMVNRDAERRFLRLRFGMSP